MSIDRAKSVLEELAQAVDAEKLFLTCAADLYISISEPASEETHGTVPALTELLAFHLSPRFGREGRPPTPAEVEKSLASLEALFEAGRLTDVDPQLADPVMKVAQEVRRRVEVVRGDEYPEQASERIVAVQGQFEEWFVARLGIGPQRAVELLWATYWQRALKAGLFMPAVLEHAEATVEEWRRLRRSPAAGLDTRERALVARKSSSVAYRFGYLEALARSAPEHLPAGPVDLQIEPPVTGREWEALLGLLGLGRTSRIPMTDPLDARGKALVVVSHSRIFLTDLSHGLDLLWERFEREIQAGQERYQEYQRTRNDWLERKTYEVLSTIFPKASVYRNLSYPDPLKPRATAELDHAVHYGSFLLLVEVKGGQFRLESQLQDAGRLRTDLRRNIEEDFEQGRRAATYIAGAASPELVEIGTGRTLTFAQGDLKRVYLLTVSLRYLGGVANRLATVRPLGLFRDGEFPFSISIADLEVIADFCEGPEVFLHYLERALEIQSQFPQVLADELDFFGAYLQTRLLPGSPLLRGASTADMVWLSGWASVFDAHMSYLRGELASPPDPLQLEVPAIIREVLAELRGRREPEAVWLALALLGTSGPGLARIASGLEEMRSTELAPGQVRYLLDQVDDLALCIVGALDPPPEEFAEKVAQRVVLEKYRRRSYRGLGFGIAVNRPDRVFECYALREGPWQHDEQLEVASRLEEPFLLGPASKMPSRNDPCSCGSGRKFKKCCLRRLRSG